MITLFGEINARRHRQAEVLGNASQNEIVVILQESIVVYGGSGGKIRPWRNGSAKFQCEVRVVDLAEQREHAVLAQDVELRELWRSMLQTLPSHNLFYLARLLPLLE